MQISIKTLRIPKLIAVIILWDSCLDGPTPRARGGTLTSPGGPGTSGFIRLPQGLADPDDMLRTEIIRALDRLERYLTDEQKNRLKQAEQNNRHPAPPTFF